MTEREVLLQIQYTLDTNFDHGGSLELENRIKSALENLSIPLHSLEEIL